MLVGLAAPDDRAQGAPTIPDLGTDEVTLENVEVFQLLCEIDAGTAEEMLPPALHPTLPGVVTWLVYACPDSPRGAFKLAQTRIECRSGTRPRGFLISGFCSNVGAAAALAEGWGYSVGVAEIDFRRDYAGVSVAVSSEDGDPHLAIGLRDPVVLPPDVVQFVSSVHAAHTPRGYRLVQVDPRHSVHRAERGDPIVEHFDGEAWGDERIVPRYPISAAVCIADVTLPRLRFLCRPGELAFQGTERV